MSETILHNVRKFYSTDYYEVEDKLTYSKGSSHYGTPVYVAGLSDYCMYWDEEEELLILEQHIPADNTWERVDTFEIEQVPESYRFTFDQNGFIAFVWEAEGIVYRCWYDTETAKQIITEVGEGRSPHILMETYNEVLQPVRQIVMVYVTGDNRLVYRIQDERYTVEHEIDPDATAVVMLGHTVRNSMKLVYLKREGEFAYRYRSIGSPRIGEWFGDNAAGDDIQFNITEMRLRHVVITNSFEDEWALNVVIEAYGLDIIKYSALKDHMSVDNYSINVEMGVSDLMVAVRNIVFVYEVEGHVPDHVTHDFSIDNYLDKDVRIDVLNEDDAPPHVEHDISIRNFEIYVPLSKLQQLYNTWEDVEYDVLIHNPTLWSNLKTALDAADDVINDVDRTNQDTTTAYYVLKEAVENLTKPIIEDLNVQVGWASIIVSPPNSLKSIVVWDPEE